MAHDVFISYSSKNKAVADAVCAGLESLQIRCWIAPRDVLAGTNYGEAIIAALESARVVVMIYSAETNLSNPIVREMERAMNFGKPIIPFRIEDVPMSRGLEFYLASCHWLDAIEPPIEKHVRPLAEAILRLSDRPIDLPVAAPSAAAPAPPTFWKRKAVWGPLLGLLVVAALGILWQVMPWKASHVEPLLSYSVLNQGRDEINQAWQPGNRLDPRYEESKSSGKSVIKPTAAWLKESRAAVNVPALQLKKETPQDAGTLVLKIELENKSKKALSVTRVEAEVEQSTPITETLLVADLPALRAGTFRLLNLGWAPVQPMDVSYGLERPGAAATPAPTPKVISFHENSSPLVEASFKTEFDGLRASGAREALFSAVVGSDSSKYNLKQTLELGSSKSRLSMASALEEAELSATLQLRDEGAHYSVSEDLSRIIKADASPEQFQIAFSAPASSQHRLRLKIIYSDGQEHFVETDPLEVELIIPRLR